MRLWFIVQNWYVKMRAAVITVLVFSITQKLYVIQFSLKNCVRFGGINKYKHVLQVENWYCKYAP